jgi:hypothetical protein
MTEAGPGPKSAMAGFKVRSSGPFGTRASCRLSLCSGSGAFLLVPPRHHLSGTDALSCWIRRDAVDPDSSGSLDRPSFIRGMALIDEQLRRRRR